MKSLFPIGADRKHYVFAIKYSTLLLFFLISIPALNAATINCAGVEDITTDSAVRYDDSAGTCTIGDNTAVLSGLDDITFVVKPDPIDGYDPPNDATEEVYFGTGSGSNQTSHSGCQLGATTITAGNSCSKPSFHVNATFTNTVNRTDSNGNSVVMTVVTTTSAGAGVDPKAMRFSIDIASVTINNAPRIISIARQTPSVATTGNDTVTWRITFDENVQNVDATDFTVSGTTATVTNVTAVSASVYDVTVSGGDLANLNATVTLSIAGGQNISDLASVALFNTTPTGTNNNTFVIQNDTSSPSVQILNAPSSLVDRNAFSVTFEFSEDVTGFAVGDITVGNGAASNFSAVDGNTYTADITPTGAGNLTIDLAAGVAQDLASNPNTAATQVLVACGAGCGEIATVAQTQKVLQNYTGNRIRHITAQGPAISGFLGGDGMGGNIGGFFQSPIALSFNGNDRNGSGSFSTSLQQMAKFSSSLNAGEDSPKVENPIPSPANVWVKGRWSKIDDERGGLNDETDFGIVYLGADYRFSDDLLIGLMAQYDWFDESDSVLNSQAEGKGWMLGPYIIARLKDSLTGDLRFAWGQSDNKINPLGTYWDSYDGERWQVEGNLTGSFKEENWHIAPTLGLNYFKDIQKSYVDSNGFTIDKQSTELGTLSFGPKMTYLADGYDGSKVHPFIILKGVWDFKAPDIYDINGIANGTEELRGLVGAGVSMMTTQGTNIEASYTYDGIGIDDYESHTVDLSASISLEDTGMPKGSSLSASYSLANILMLRSEDTNNAKVQLTIPFN